MRRFSWSASPGQVGVSAETRTSLWMLQGHGICPPESNVTPAGTDAMSTKGDGSAEACLADGTTVASPIQSVTWPPALVLGTGITALGVVRALGRAGIPVQVLSSSPGPVVYSRWYRRPPYRRLLRAPELLEEYLEALPLEHGVLIPASDEAISAISRLPESFRARFPSSIARRDVVEAFIDKAKLHEILREYGVPHPRTIVLDNRRPDATEMDMGRAFLKPRNSQDFARRFGVKAVRPRDPDDLREKALWYMDRGIGLILQEYVPGPPTNHYFVDGFMDVTGTVRARLCRRRLRMFPKDFGNSSAVVTVAPEEIEPAVGHLERLLGGLRYRGAYSAEFKLDERDGEFRLLEINARPWWYVEFAARCGVDVVMMAYLDSLGAPVDDALTYPVGRRMVYPIHDIGAWRELRASAEGGSLLDQLYSLLVADWATFAVDDPLPGWMNAGAIVGRVLRRKLRAFAPGSTSNHSGAGA